MEELMGLVDGQGSPGALWNDLHCEPSIVSV